jgi:hypothetical protein
MNLTDWTPPNCPQCKADSMRHICFSHVISGAAFKKNGWYCDICKAGPFQLGNVTEADAAIFAKQLNAPRRQHEAIKNHP